MGCYPIVEIRLVLIQPVKEFYEDFKKLNGVKNGNESKMCK
jgi:hypothetical protein